MSDKKKPRELTEEEKERHRNGLPSLLDGWDPIREGYGPHKTFEQRVKELKEENLRRIAREDEKAARRIGEPRTPEDDDAL